MIHQPERLSFVDICGCFLHSLFHDDIVHPDSSIIPWNSRKYSPILIPKAIKFDLTPSSSSRFGVAPLPTHGITNPPWPHQRSPVVFFPSVRRSTTSAQWLESIRCSSCHGCHGFFRVKMVDVYGLIAESSWKKKVGELLVNLFHLISAWFLHVWLKS